MSGLIRRIRRSTKKAAKFIFTASLQELHIVISDAAKHPKSVCVAFQHRRRRVECQERSWEPSFSKPEQSIIVWPELTSDAVDIRTTLYKGANDEAYEDKEWTVIVEEVTGKGRHRPLAAVPINMRLFIHDQAEQRSQLRLKLRPLTPQVLHCQVVLTLSSTFITEGFRDDLSVASSISARPSREQSVVEADCSAPTIPHDPEAEKQIARISDDIQKEFAEDSTTTRKYEDWEKRRTSDLEGNSNGATKDPSLCEASPSIRPPWRVSSDQQKHTSSAADPVLSQLNKLPTAAFFEVDANSRPVPVAAPPCSFPGHLRESSTDPPEKREGEELLEWCRRVVALFPSAKIIDIKGRVDIAKSFRNGIVLCALIHAYRPDIIGDLSSLDYSESVSGRRRNIEKALHGAAHLGISEVPEASDILTPDAKQIRLLLEKMRRLLEGNIEQPTPTAGSDHRISRMYFVSDSEKGLIADLAQLQEATQFYTPSSYKGVTEEDAEKVRTLERPTKGREKQENGVKEKPDQVEEASTSDNEAEGSDESDGTARRMEKENEDGSSLRFHTPVLPAGRASPTKREELRKKARQLLDNPITAIQATSTPPPESRRLEARFLLSDAAAATTSGGGGLSQRGSPSVTGSRSSLNTSSCDLRTLGTVQPAVSFYSFRKRDPSPILQRKMYEQDSPRVPAIGIAASTKLGLPSAASFRRFGSMRAGELRESITALAAHYATSGVEGGTHFPAASTSSPSRFAQQPHSTPTRKITAQWEQYVDDAKKLAREQESISEELERLEAELSRVDAAIRSVEAGGEAEERLVNERLEIMNERNSLVQRQEYFNIIENIRENGEEVSHLKEQLDERTREDDGFARTIEEKETINQLMEKFRAAVARKDELTSRLIALDEEAEAEDESHLAPSHFVRGTDQPVSASRRMAQGLKDWLTG